MACAIRWRFQMRRRILQYLKDRLPNERITKSRQTSELGDTELKRSFYADLYALVEAEGCNPAGATEPAFLQQKKVEGWVAVFYNAVKPRESR